MVEEPGATVTVSMTVVPGGLEAPEEGTPLEAYQQYSVTLDKSHSRIDSRRSGGVEGICSPSLASVQPANRCKIRLRRSSARRFAFRQLE